VHVLPNRPGSEPPVTSPSEEPAWKQRAVERSIKTAKLRAAQRVQRFLDAAQAIIIEKGSTDFTVQEVVARSKTSLRAFYQHFSSKDELLLALFDRTISQSALAWRAEASGLDSISALKLLIDRISQQPESSTQDSLNRALGLYNQHLADTRPREYARVLSPLYQLIRDIVGQGITEGVFNPGLDVGASAAIVMPCGSPIWSSWPGWFFGVSRSMV